MCRYGHQDVYRVLGRDPLKRPLTPLELALYERCVWEAVDREFTPRVERTLATGHPHAPGE